MSTHRFPLISSLLLWAAGAASGCDDFRECRAPGGALDQLPLALSATGLYADLARDELAPGVRPFTPNFALWSDGALKRRFIYLPDDARIDTSDMDDWQFPAGTKLWKEFTRDGVRVETRLEQKIGPAPSDWLLVSYLWNETEDDATRLSDALHDARGTPHDIPSAAQCLGCHGGRKSGALGFSAVQLAHAEPDPDGSLDLQQLTMADRLSDPPANAPRVPGTEQQEQGLGYLHANCSHCHNQTRPDNDGPRCYDPQRDFDFALRVDHLQRVEDTSTYRTGIEQDAFRPGFASVSDVVQRMRVRKPDWPSMPPLGTEQVDDAGLRAVRAFIDSL